MAQEIEIGIKVDGLAKLKKDLKEARGELAEMVRLSDEKPIDQAAFDAAARRAGELKDKLNEVNEQIAVMSGGSGFERLSSGLGLLGGQLANLDFEGAAQSAKNLTGVIKGLDPKEVANGFKGLIGTVGQLGNAFFQMGLKLLANPLFLLVAVVAAVAIAMVMLKDKLVIVEKAFDLVMAPIKVLIQGLKDLTDWMGITAFAAEESAERQIAANEKASKKSKEVTDARIRNLERQKKILEAEGKDTTEIEVRIQNERIKGSKEQLNLARSTYNELDAIRKAGKVKLNEDQKKQLEDAAKVIKEEKSNIADAETEKNAIIIGKNKELADKKNAEGKKQSDSEKAEAKKQKDALIRIEQDFIREIEDLNAKTDEQKLELQKQRDQKELDSIKLSKEEKLLAQKKLDEKYKILGENLERDKQKTIFDTINDFTNRTKELNAKTDQEKFQLQLENQAKERDAKIKELEELGANEEQKKAVRDYYLQLENDTRETFRISEEEKRKKNAQDLLDKQTELTRRLIEVENAYQEAKRNALQTGLDILLQFAGKNKTIALAILAVQKGLAVADVVIGASKAIALAKFNLAQIPFMLPPGVINPAWVTQAGMTAKSIATTKISAVASIASILASGIGQATQISGGGSSSGGAGGSSSGGGASSAPSTPALALFGKNSSDNIAEGAKTTDANRQQNIMVTAVVSETQVTSTQNRVARMERSAEL